MSDVEPSLVGKVDERLAHRLFRWGAVAPECLPRASREVANNPPTVGT
jgi:hypothetical protein